MYGQIPPPSLLPSYDPVFANNSWEIIAECSELGIAKDIWSADGSCTKALPLSTGENLSVEIIDFDHDDLADESGKAGISFGILNVMKDFYQMDSGKCSNYLSSELHALLNGQIFDSLPSELKPLVKTVNKKTAIHPSGEISVDPMKLFVFSEREFMGEKTIENDGYCNNSYPGEGHRYQRYYDETTALRYLPEGSIFPGSDCCYWTRSHEKDGVYNSFCCTNYYDGKYDVQTREAPSDFVALVFGFCI